MRELLIGEYIRERRKDLGLTQINLCEGLCEPSTLCRLERGVHAPSSGLVNPLLQRLGLPGGRFFALLNENEAAVEALQKEIRADEIRFYRAIGDMKSQIREETVEKLVQLEKLAGKTDRCVQQFILGTMVALGKPEDSEDRLEMLMKAIRLTVPLFDLDQIALKRYSMEEVKIINQIAITFKREGKRKQAIDVYRQLLAYIEANHQELVGYAGHFCLVAHNYSIALCLEKCYMEAIEIANKGWKVCVKYGDYQFLPGFLATLAECYYFMGDHKQSAELYLQAYSIYYAIHDENGLVRVRQEMKERLNLDDPF
ncbi:MAG: helix-turn-helix transcriptional regulator [Oscillospiraceae bacterium]|nr:helix-turn-helix transcriptional regulator [Oscillospiraceae bacterium]